MPLWLMSSSRPTKGLTYVPPALATSSACVGEKHSVMLILMPCSLRHLQALMPSRVMGSLTTTFLCHLAYSCPSLHMVPASVATTSTLTGPFTASQMERIVSLKGLPSLATREGLVVTPSRMPRAAASRISFTLAVSTKNFIKPILLAYHAIC